MHLTPRELDKLMIHMMADVALKRKAKGLKLNHPEAVAVIAAAALEGAREGKRLQQLVGLAGQHALFRTRHRIEDGHHHQRDQHGHAQAADDGYRQRFL